MKRLIMAKEDTINKIPLENKLKQLEDIAIHKKHIIETSYQLARYLISNGREEESLELMKRCFEHDMSKLNNDEFYGMAEFAYDMKSLKDPKVKPSEEKQKAIDLHWKNNKHHPEYWKDITDIDEMSIMELACDWQARSIQMETNSLDYLKQSQENRFHFPKDIYDKIELYLKMFDI